MSTAHDQRNLQDRNLQDNSGVSVAEQNDKREAVGVGADGENQSRTERRSNRETLVPKLADEINSTDPLPSNDAAANLLRLLNRGEYSAGIAFLESQLVRASSEEVATILTPKILNLLIDGGYYSWVMKPVPVSSPIAAPVDGVSNLAASFSLSTTQSIGAKPSNGATLSNDNIGSCQLLAGFLLDRFIVQPSNIQQLLVNPPSDTSAISALAQLSIQGYLFRRLPSTFLDQGRKMLAALALSQEQDGQHDEAINNLLRLAALCIASPTHDFASAIFLLERAHRLCTANSEPEVLVGIRLAELRVRSGIWKPEQLREQVQDVYARRNTLSPRTVVQSLARAGDTLLGYLSEAQEWQKEAIAIASASGDLAGTVQGRLRLGNFLVGIGELASASRHFLEAEALAEKIGFALGVFGAQVGRVQNLLQQGRRDDALALALRVRDRIPASNCMGLYALPLAVLLDQLGLGGDAHRLLKSVEQLYKRGGAVNMHSQSLALRGAFLGATGDIGGARRFYRQAVTLDNEIGDSLGAVDKLTTLAQLEFAAQAKQGNRRCRWGRASIRKAKSLLPFVPEADAKRITAKVAQLEGHCLLLEKKHLPSLKALSKARELLGELHKPVELAFLDGMIGLVALDAARNNNPGFYREAHAAFCRSRDIFVAYQIEREICRMDVYLALTLIESMNFVGSMEERVEIANTADSFLEEAWIRLERIRQQDQTLMAGQDELSGTKPEAQVINLAQKLEAIRPADGERRELWRARRELLLAMEGKIKVLH